MRKPTTGPTTHTLRLEVGDEGILGTIILVYSTMEATYHAVAANTPAGSFSQKLTEEAENSLTFCRWAVAETVPAEFLIVRDAATGRIRGRYQCSEMVDRDLMPLE